MPECGIYWTMIDILLSTYNGERWLSEQLDSILAQTYTEWRLLIRDDGSTDGTVTLLTDYVNRFPEHLNMLQDSGHIGCLRSFERLLQEATAEYIGFADQDDIWLPEKLSHMLKVAMESEKVIPSDTPLVVYSDLQVVNKDLDFIDASFEHFVRLRPELLIQPASLATCNYVTGCAMLFNQAAKNASLPFGPNAFMHDAVVALSTLSHGGQIVFSPHADVLYRQHDDNVLGAVQTQKGLAYLGFKLRSIGDVWRCNKRNYRQAKDIIQCSPWVFAFHRIKYLLQR